MRSLFAPLVLGTLLINQVKAQTDGGERCYTNFTEIGLIEDFADVQQVREYVICPNTEMDISFTDNQGQLLGNMTPLAVRANMHIKCGRDGRSTNNCTLNGGSFGIVAFQELFGFEFLFNVYFSGLRFRNFLVHGSILVLPGNFTYNDCIFEYMSNIAPSIASWFPSRFFPESRAATKSLPGIEAQTTTTTMPPLNVPWRRGRSLQQFSPVYREPRPDDILEITYENCLFQHNSVVDLIRFGGTPTVVATYGETVTVMNKCRFFNNTYSESLTGAYNAATLVIQESGNITIRDSCFGDNGVASAAPVLVLFGAGVSSDTQVTSITSKCSLMATYSNLGPDDSLADAPFDSCVEADSDEACMLIEGGGFSTASPAVPSAAPTVEMDYSSAAPTASVPSSEAPTLKPLTTKPSPPNSTETMLGGSGSNGDMGIVVGATVGAFVAVGMACVVVLLYNRRRKQRRSNENVQDNGADLAMTLDEIQTPSSPGETGRDIEPVATVYAPRHNMDLDTPQAIREESLGELSTRLEEAFHQIPQQASRHQGEEMQPAVRSYSQQRSARQQNKEQYGAGAYAVSGERVIRRNWALNDGEEPSVFSADTPAELEVPVPPASETESPPVLVQAELAHSNTDMQEQIFELRAQLEALRRASVTHRPLVEAEDARSAVAMLQTEIDELRQQINDEQIHAASRQRRMP